MCYCQGVTVSPTAAPEVVVVATCGVLAQKTGFAALDVSCTSLSLALLASTHWCSYTQRRAAAGGFRANSNMTTSQMSLQVVAGDLNGARTYRPSPVQCFRSVLVTARGSKVAEWKRSTVSNGSNTRAMLVWSPFDNKYARTMLKVLLGLSDRRRMRQLRLRAGACPFTLTCARRRAF